MHSVYPEFYGIRHGDELAYVFLQSLSSLFVTLDNPAENAPLLPPSPSQCCFVEFFYSQSCELTSFEMAGWRDPSLANPLANNKAIIFGQQIH